LKSNHYNLQPWELEGIKGWMESDLYSIEGVAPDPATAKYQDLLVMLQHLLTSRVIIGSFDVETSTPPRKDVGQLCLCQGGEFREYALAV
jgi:hypothetical protein